MAALETRLQLVVRLDNWGRYPSMGEVSWRLSAFLETFLLDRYVFSSTDFHRALFSREGSLKLVCG